MGVLEEFLPWDDNNKDFNGGKKIGRGTTILILVSGMLGTSLLVVPLIGTQTGYWTTLWMSFLVGYCLYYTAQLVLTHMGQAKNMKQSILAHFHYNYKYMTGYSLLMWFSFIPFLILRFKTICLEVCSLLGYSSDRVAICICIVLVVFTLTVRYTHYAQETMAIGIVAYGIFMIFLMWAVITAPEGPKKMPKTGSTYQLAATLISSLQVHDYLSQNIKKNPSTRQYKSILKYSFLIGLVVYIFATLCGYAIINRHTYVHHVQVVTDFFQQSSWQVVIVELAFIIVSITSFPNFLIISKVRFFQIFHIDLKSRTTLKEVIYIMIMAFVCLFVYETGLSFQVMYAINGTVIALHYTTIVPIWIHFKCIWYDRSSGTIENDPEWNSQLKPNICSCKNHYSSKWTLYLQTTFLVGMVVLVYLLITQMIVKFINRYTF